jgi:hypothetical protein
MTGFVPRDCLSCVDALNETYQDIFGTKHCFTNVEWSVVFSDSRVQRSAGLKRQVADHMKQAIHSLQGQLFEGERTACFVGDEGLTDIKPTVFGKENIAKILAENGKIRPKLIGQSVTFFVHPKGYERSDHPVGSAQHEEVDTGKNRGGRPSTGRDAALIYWGMFPDGHDSKVTSWKGVLRDVNRQLERLGLKAVEMTSFKVNVNELRPRE